jgi:hypothetical protein
MVPGRHCGTPKLKEALLPGIQAFGGHQVFSPQGVYALFIDQVQYRVQISASSLRFETIEMSGGSRTNVLRVWTQDLWEPSRCFPRTMRSKVLSQYPTMKKTFLK